MFFFQHVLIIILALWNVFVDGMITSKYAILRTMVFLNLMIFPVGIINWLTDSNYMYISQKPHVDSPFIIGEWPWYILSLEVVGLLMMLIAAIPMAIANKVRSRNTLSWTLIKKCIYTNFCVNRVINLINNSFKTLQFLFVSRHFPNFPKTRRKMLNPNERK